jgi:hypothetical protein
MLDVCRYFCIVFFFFFYIFQKKKCLFICLFRFKKKISKIFFFARLLFEHDYIVTVVYMSLVCLTC